MRDYELPGIPVVNEGGRCVGIITEADLIMAGEEADLHLPHYIELFGGMVFLESTQKFEERLRKAIASTARDVMTEEPVTIAPGRDGGRGGAADRPSTSTTGCRWSSTAGWSASSPASTCSTR